MANSYTVKQGDTLNSIASNLGFKNYKEAGFTGYGSNPDLIQAGQVLNYGGSVIPETTPVNTNVSASDLSNSTPITIPTANQTNPYAGLGAGAGAYVASTQTQNQVDQTAGDAYIKSLQGLESVDTNAIKSDLETKYGLTTKADEARKLKAQIEQNTAEATAGSLTQQERLASMGAISGAQADIERKLAIRNLPLTAQYQAAQGDYKAAEDTVNKLYTAEVEDSTNKYNRKLDLIKAAYEVASGKEKTALEAKAKEEERKYEAEKDTIEFNRKKELAKYEAGLKTSGVTTNGGVSDTTQAIINNPSLFDDLTSTERGKVITQLQSAGYDTTNLGLKGLDSTAITTISQSQKALDDLGVLKQKISENLQYVGPISGFAALNPYSKARQVQADVDRVRQTVGKALEGGVLRKEDEEKYKKILATLTDTPETAVYKIDALVSSIQRDIENYKTLQTQSGRSANIGTSLPKKGSSTVTKTEDLRSKYNY